MDGFVSRTTPYLFGARLVVVRQAEIAEYPILSTVSSPIFSWPELFDLLFS